MIEAGYKLFIYKMLEKIGTKSPLFNFYSLLILSDKIGFVNFIRNCKELADLIVENGSAVPITDLALKTRASLALPPLNFNKDEIKKLAELSELYKTIGRSK